ILGLDVDQERPDLGYPGAWLHVGHQQIHLLELPNPDPVEGRPEHGGRDRHVAMQVDSITLLKNRLDRANI
ncbi:MAG: glyoxalase, partial [Gammaproteobacteria bacterium]|nr:glyoxalase [Gammaproteobacteria bacterium]NIR25851.1 glyoxalase [Gammaproteobacteria bacterium]